MKVQDIAELLIASWILTGERDSLPTGDGILDRALRDALESGAFPAPWRERLNFADGRAGLECVELKSVINSAQLAGFSSDPNPSYQATSMKISVKAALRLLRRHSIAEDDAKKWGAALRAGVEKARATMRDYPSPA